MGRRDLEELQVQDSPVEPKVGGAKTEQAGLDGAKCSKTGGGAAGSSLTDAAGDDMTCGLTSEHGYHGDSSEL